LAFRSIPSLVIRWIDSPRSQKHVAGDHQPGFGRLAIRFAAGVIDGDLPLRLEVKPEQGQGGFG